MKKIGQYYFFFSAVSPFSNWHLGNFTYLDKEFRHGEQAFMYAKAILFRDFDTANLILNSPSPKECKRLGRLVKNFEQKTWISNRENIMEEVSYHKFISSPHLRKALFATAPHTLVEASPYDKVWGIGMGIDHPDISNPSKWKGLNLLGKALGKARSKLMLKFGEVYVKDDLFESNL